MKKNIFYIFLFLMTILSINIVFWDDSKIDKNCKIKNWSSVSLDTYILNLRKAVSNIRSEVVSSKSVNDKWSVEKDLWSIKEKTFWLYWESISWDSYYTDFDFYVIYWANTEYVSEVWRDYNMLIQEEKTLDKFFQYSTRRGWEVKITKDILCKWIDASICDFDWSVLDVISKLMKNHEDIKNYYKLSILWKKNDFTWDLKLVPNNFVQDFDENYNENTSASCSKTDWWNWKKVKEESGKIMNFSEMAEKWIKEWTRALSLINWSLSAEKQNEADRKILEKWLAKNWFSTESSNSILKNFDRYWDKNSWFTFENNFITNTFKYISDKISNQNTTLGSIIWWMLGSWADSKVNKSLSKAQINNNYDYILENKDIEKTIDSLYLVENQSSFLIDNSNEALLSKLLWMHASISAWIKRLEEVASISSSICSYQSNWLWNCLVK